jgi:hypothetical protein
MFYCREESECDAYATALILILTSLLDNFFYKEIANKAGLVKADLKATEGYS